MGWAWQEFITSCVDTAVPVQSNLWVSAISKFVNACVLVYLGAKFAKFNDSSKSDHSPTQNEVNKMNANESSRSESSEPLDSSNSSFSMSMEKLIISSVSNNSSSDNTLNQPLL